MLLFKCKPGMGAPLLNAFKTSLEDTRAFDGCVSVSTFVDVDNPDTVMLYEEWATRGQQETYVAWRIEGGMEGMLEPVLAAPLETYYLEADPA
jgi:quinol monooxygenase YgiN